tara:strand:- start:57 stop:662 length:606 start_codon:yes stop_codon:yes gene_type:complete
MNLNKGAMFGLDARIALAIFGALSVISGAALYSAIQESKVVSMVTQLEELSKAYISYFIDTGSEMPERGSLTYDLLVESLYLDDGVAGWNGPYFTPTTKIANYAFSQKYSYENVRTYIQKCGDSFGGDFSSTSCTECIAGMSCSIYIKLMAMDNGLNIANKLDAEIDNADGFDKGKFRVQYADATATDNLRYFYYVKPLDN